MNYRELLTKYVEDSGYQNLVDQIIRKITLQYTTGDVAEWREGKKYKKIIEHIVYDCCYKEKRYTASLIPPMISIDKARNFYIGSSMFPSKDEAYKWLYLLITGLIYQDKIVNLDNISYDLQEDFRRFLIDENFLILRKEKQKRIGINLSRFREIFEKITLPSNKEFVFGLQILSMFAHWIKSKAPKRIKIISEMGLQDLFRDLTLNEETALVIFVVPRTKKSMYFFPRINTVILKWFGKYITHEEKIPAILEVLSSLYIHDKKYRDRCGDLINKFTYYLLNGYVNGELLSNLINIKTSYSLKEKQRVYGVKSIDEVYKLL